jgi:hypothetical protein
MIGYDLGDGTSEPAVSCVERLPGGKLHVHWVIKGDEAQKWLAANVPQDDTDPPSYLPVSPGRHGVDGIPDLNPDEQQRHKDGSIRPYNCRCAEECWTDEDDAAWRKEWREST